MGQYPSSSGRVGGTLKNGWIAGEVTRSGNILSVEIINPVEYAPCVEYGHRTAGHGGWVNGRFMLEISVQEVQYMTRSLLENKLKGYLEGLV